MIFKENLDMSIDYTYLPFPGKGAITWIDVQLWCEGHMGIGHFSMGGHGVYFEKEEDAIMFALAYK